MNGLTERSLTVLVDNKTVSQWTHPPSHHWLQLGGFWNLDFFQLGLYLSTRSVIKGISKRPFMTRVHIQTGMQNIPPLLLSDLFIMATKCCWHTWPTKNAIWHSWQILIAEASIHHVVLLSMILFKENCSYLWSVRPSVGSLSPCSVDDLGVFLCTV